MRLNIKGQVLQTGEPLFELGTEITPGVPTAFNPPVTGFRGEPLNLIFTVSEDEEMRFAKLMKRPIYINDSGVVSCYNCDGYTFEWIGRRCTVSDLLAEMVRHMEEECPNG